VAYLRSLVLLAVVLGMAASGAVAQEPPPSGPFRAVHLVSLTPQQVTTLQAWMAEMNAFIDKTGHKDVRYRLFRVVGKQAGKYDFMWESSWPSGAVYQKIHSMPEWKEIGGKHPEVSEVLKDEIYNRYVEVTTSR
jgi:hypothetical protein